MKHNISYKTLDAYFPSLKWVRNEEKYGKDLVGWGELSEGGNIMLVVISDALEPHEGGKWYYDIWTLSNEYKTVLETQLPVIPNCPPMLSLPGLFCEMNQSAVSGIEPDKRPIVIAVCGESGCGKTVLTRYLEKYRQIHNIVSYTTREMRPGETNGVEHWFVSEKDMPDKSEMLAYTYFGGNHYWAAMKDIEENRISTYVIDERGIVDLTDMQKAGKIRLLWIQITRPDNPTDEDRKKRDECRATAIAELNRRGFWPDALIVNDYKTVDEFLKKEGQDISDWTLMF